MLAKAYKFQEKTRKTNFAENFAQIAELWNSAAWHTRACAQKDEPLKRGGRAAMDREQVATLFGIMKELAPWSAVLMLLQLFIGERVDAARQCTWQWISGHDPSCGATPMIRVPSV